MYEYNADSASALYEYGVIQQHWADITGTSKIGRPAGADIKASMKSVWEKVAVALDGAICHFLIDDDDEEDYTARFVMEYAVAAGVTVKLIRSKACRSCPKSKRLVTKDFVWKHGQIVDMDDVPVKFVWKTWCWCSIFDDYEEVMKERDPAYEPKDGDHPHLCDILLAPRTIKVIEPLWKSIPGNKAILPVLWEMFPNHPNLLRSEWSPSETLKASGYASKPVVSRGGQNVSLVKPGGAIMAETSGRFGERDMVYQELCPLPSYDGHHVLIGGWVIGGVYGGAGIREDDGLITQIDSPCPPLLVAFDSTESEREVVVDTSLVAKFDSIIGYTPDNTPVYSSDYETRGDDKELSIIKTDGGDSTVVCGRKWHSMEFIRRYLVSKHHINFSRVPTPFHMFHLRKFYRTTHINPEDSHDIKAESHLNGSKIGPTIGSLLIWKPEFKNGGHVAVITDVQGSNVLICEQNWDNTMWKTMSNSADVCRNYSRKLEVSTEDGHFKINEKGLVGWVNIHLDV